MVLFWVMADIFPTVTELKYSMDQSFKTWLGSKIEPRDEVTATRVSRVTMGDIASELGLSLTTVSRALNDKPDISRKTRKRVLEVARQKGYVPSALGQSLACGYARAVGCLVTRFTDPYVALVLEGIEEVAKEVGLTLIMATSQMDLAAQIEAMKTFAAYSVRGVAVIDYQVEQLHRSNLQNFNAPVVLISSDSYPNTNSVRLDDRLAAYQAVSYLVELGHRQIAHITASRTLESSRAQMTGYTQAVQEHGLGYVPEFVVEAEDSERGGAYAAQRLLRSQPQPSAIFCFNDRIAIGAIGALREAGLAVPHNVSVIGYDDISVAEWITPPLTTMRPPARQMGRLAMTLILKQLKERSNIEDVVVQAELVVRQSTAPPRFQSSC
jgi:LacI family transcriptional regulator